VPRDRYFQGHGDRVMREMRKRYGKDAERVFHATANARKQKPGDRKKARAKVRKRG
jgi:hypothetical protein